MIQLFRSDRVARPPGRRTAHARLRPGLALAFLVLLASPAAGAPEAAVLSRAEGAVEVGVGDPPRFRAAREGETLPAGAVLRTGPEARAEVRRGGETLRLYGDTLLRLDVAPARTRVELERGRSLFDVLRGSGRRFEVQTREVAVLVKGTRFLVDAEDAFVSVFRGVVGVAELGGGGSPVDVRAGLSLLGGGGAHPLELHLTPFADPWDGWPRDVAPPQLERPAPEPALDRQAATEVRHALGERSPRLAERLTPEDVAPALREEVSAERGEALPAKRLDPVLDVPRDRDLAARRAANRAASRGRGAPAGAGSAGAGNASPGQPPGGVTGLLDDLLGPDGPLAGLGDDDGWDDDDWDDDDWDDDDDDDDDD